MIEPAYIKLNPRDMLIARGVGELRHEQSYRLHFKQIDGRVATVDDSLENDIAAAQAEYAFFLWSGGVQWNMVDDFAGGKKTADIDNWIDVKAVSSEHRRLIVKPREREPDAWAYVSVCYARRPIFHLRWWCFGGSIRAAIEATELVKGRAKVHAVPNNHYIRRSVFELRDMMPERNHMLSPTIIPAI